MGQYTDKMTQKCVKMSLFVRVVTHYGSNESNDSLGVFSDISLCLAMLRRYAYCTRIVTMLSTPKCPDEYKMPGLPKRSILGMLVRF